MDGSDFGIVLKREAGNSLAAFKNQSLLRRKFGQDAVALYEAIDGQRRANEIIASIGMAESRFLQILEFMNNNAMVSVAGGGEGEGETPPSPKMVAAEESVRAPPVIRPAEPSGVDEDLLSPLEKVIFETYGELGVRVYNLIDGEKTAEEILRETGMTEAKLVEILEFMDERGIIRLEKPQEESLRPPPKRQEKEEEEAKPAREPRFSPMSEDVPEGKPFAPPKPPELPKEKKAPPPESVEEPGEDILMVDVPELARLSVVQRAAMLADISTKFDKRAGNLMNLADGKLDFVELCIATGLSFYDIDAVMAHFGTKGFVTFRQLDRQEIKKKYGEDGFAIYKRFGRDGLLLYEMIGKEASLKDIIMKSQVDPERAIEIFMFIHRVLGLDVPLDKDIIYRQIGLKK